MKKILFACDLDNTLIHSLRHKSENDICIEKIDGKEQGFMSKTAIELLEEINQLVEFVPITTRSVEQYKRILWPDNCRPRFAITTNGSVLLKCDEVDEEWRSCFNRLVSPVYDKLLSIKDQLIAQGKYIRVRIVNDMYLFAYCKDGIDIITCAAENQNIEGINVISSGRKLYFFPHGMDKGSALLKFQKENSSEIIISAGDSSIDLPMLQQANIAIVPSLFLARQLDVDNVVVKPEEIPFATFVLQHVKNVAKGLK